MATIRGPTIYSAAGGSLSCLVNYTGTGQQPYKVTGVTVTNTTPGTRTVKVDVVGQAMITQQFAVGGPFTISFPPNVVSVSLDANGEPTWNGLLSLAMY